MTRLAQMLVLAIWILGAAIGGLTVQPSPSADESLTFLIDTDYAHLGRNRTQAVLTVTIPWRTEGRAAAPLPEGLAPSRAEDASSAPPSEPSAVQFTVALFIRSLVSLP